jgi:hypothetical protein
VSDWIKVVTQPLGLSGFALFLAFSYIAKAKPRFSPHWLTSSAYIFALIALVGGLGLAYRDSAGGKTVPPRQSASDIHQSAIGNSATNVAGVQGNVSVVTTSGLSEGSPPLTLQEMKNLLAAKVDPPVILAEVQRRGIAFAMGPELRAQLRSAGANTDLISALDAKSPQ